MAPSLAFLVSVGLNVAGLPSGPSGQRLIANLNQFEAFGVLSPALFLGGAVLALAISLAAQVRVDLALQAGTLHGTARLRLQPASILLAATSVVVLAVLASYVLAENWGCLAGQRLAC